MLLRTPAGLALALAIATVTVDGKTGVGRMATSNVDDATGWIAPPPDDPDQDSGADSTAVSTSTSTSTSTPAEIPLAAQNKFNLSTPQWLEQGRSASSSSSSSSSTSTAEPETTAALRSTSTEIMTPEFGGADPEPATARTGGGKFDVVPARGSSSSSTSTTGPGTTTTTNEEPVAADPSPTPNTADVSMSTTSTSTSTSTSTYEPLSGHTTVQAGISGCVLVDDSPVPHGWVGPGVGAEYCNRCFCSNGTVGCTRNTCGQHCPEVRCLMYCEHGHAVDMHGCQTCGCNRARVSTGGSAASRAGQTVETTAPTVSTASTVAETEAASTVAMTTAEDAARVPPPLQEGLCHGMCQQIFPLTTTSGRRCSCHSACKDIGDCCPGYDAHCSDASTPFLKSNRTCDVLGISDGFAFKTAGRVCAQSQLDSGCYRAVSPGVAAALCAGVGARLCTLGELQLDLSSSTGCGMNNRDVWSSTPCGVEGRGFLSAGGIVSEGDGLGNPAAWLQRVQCTTNYASSSAGARCCADAAVTTSTAPVETTGLELPILDPSIRIDDHGGGVGLQETELGSTTTVYNSGSSGNHWLTSVAVTVGLCALIISAVVWAKFALRNTKRESAKIQGWTESSPTQGNPDVSYRADHSFRPSYSQALGAIEGFRNQGGSSHIDLGGLMEDVDDGDSSHDGNNRGKDGRGDAHQEYVAYNASTEYESQGYESVENLQGPPIDIAAQQGMRFGDKEDMDWDVYDISSSHSGTDHGDDLNPMDWARGARSCSQKGATRSAQFNQSGFAGEPTLQPEAKLQLQSSASREAAVIAQGLDRSNEPSMTPQGYMVMKSGVDIEKQTSLGVASARARAASLSSI